MKICVGIDLGSTTTKAVVLDHNSNVVGRGITNSRSNYDVACQVALCEALNDTRFGLVREELESSHGHMEWDLWMAKIEAEFRRQQYLRQLEQLHRTLVNIGAEHGEALDRLHQTMMDETPTLFEVGARRKSDFFRDLAGHRYMELADQLSRAGGAPFSVLSGLFDKAVLQVENTAANEDSFATNVAQAVANVADAPMELTAAVKHASDTVIEQVASVGTGYGRQRLPFPEGQIRSEILCHGLGAHAMFPETRTVLDIGGQDTKAIQIDNAGIVTSFQMNDRCAAGCGRYLGYIADEMNLGVQELGPLAQTATRTARINSTCTVFAGAELRERLSLGERREDILSGLHRAIILRAMSLLARSGGISSEFTFTGGVAKNPAAVDALRLLIEENYGSLTMNISPESIYTGALGAALFACRDWQRSAAA